MPVVLFTLWVITKCCVPRSLKCANRYISRSPSVSSLAVVPGCGTQSVVRKGPLVQIAKLNAGTLIGMLPSTPRGLTSQGSRSSREFKLVNVCVAGEEIVDGSH